MTETPSTRYQSCCIQAIKELSKYDSLTSEQQNVMNQAINELPIDDDYLRIFVKQTYPTNASEILKRTAQLVEQKNKEEEKIAIINSPLKVTDYEANTKLFWEVQPFFYDPTGIYWFWNKEESSWQMVDEIDVMNAIHKNLIIAGETISSSRKNNYLEAFRRIGRQRIPKTPPSSWVQLKNKIFDADTKKITQATPEYFICNPIPWSLGENTETPTLDKLFTEWVGEDYVQTLYEIMAYCCIPSYPIHIAVCMVGSGRNGKSQFQKILGRFVGHKNLCSTELDTIIDSRFESFKLYKKLICLLGETNFGVLNKTSLFKKLTGGDVISYEAKGKKGFDDYSYAKIIIGSNSMPISTDTSEGFYRRWLIIDFPNNFQEGKEIWETVPEKEYEALARKITTVLPALLDKGSFHNQGSISEREARYIQASNPLPLFLHLFCKTDAEGWITSRDLYQAYTTYLRRIKKRRVTRKEFGIALLDEGWQARRADKKVGEEFVKDYYIEGISFILSLKEVFDGIDTFDTNSILPHFISYIKGRNSVENGENVENLPKMVPPTPKSIINISPVEMKPENASNGDIINICGCDQQKVSQEILLDNITRAQPDWRYEDAINFVKNCGFCEQHTEALLTHWKAQGDIFEVRPGYLMGRK